MMLAETTAAKQSEMANVCVATSAPRETENRPQVYSSEELLQGRKEAWIEHGEQMYRLRLTSQGKL